MGQNQIAISWTVQIFDLVSQTKLQSCTNLLDHQWFLKVQEFCGRSHHQENLNHHHHHQQTRQQAQTTHFLREKRILLNYSEDNKLTSNMFFYYSKIDITNKFTSNSSKLEIQ